MKGEDEAVYHHKEISLNSKALVIIHSFVREITIRNKSSVLLLQYLIIYISYFKK
jgi:hypothetical protein